MAKAASFRDSNGIQWLVLDDELPDWWIARAVKIPDGTGGTRWPYSPEGANTVRLKPDGIIGKVTPPMDALKAGAEAVAAAGAPELEVQADRPQGGGASGLLLGIVVLLLLIGGDRR